MAKWILAITVALLLVFSALVALIYTKENQIIRQALSNYNETIPGEISLQKTTIALFQNFPYISIDLKGLALYENKTDTQPIIKIADAYLGFDVCKVLKGEFDIKKIKINGGYINAKVYANGQYNILKALGLYEPNSEDTSTTAVTFDLKSVVINGVKLVKSSEENNTTIEVLFKSFFTELRKNTTNIFVDLNGGLELSVITNDSTLVNNRDIDVNTKIDYSKQSEVATIISSAIKLESVEFKLLGSADFKNDFDLDLKVHGEKEDFSLLITFLPDELYNFMQRYENAGNIVFDAVIKGKSIKGNLPYFEASFGCKNGYFKNTNVNRTLDDLSFSGYYTNGENRDLTTSEFRLKDFNAKPEQGIVKADLVIKNFVDPYVDLKVYTDFDLQFLADFIQVTTLQNLKGKVLLDVNYNELVDVSLSGASLKGIKQGINSKLTIKNLEFKIPEYPFDFKNINASATMNEGKLTLDSFSINVGKSDLWVSGYLSNLPSILHSADEDVVIAVSMKSSLLDIKSLTTFDTTKLQPINEKIDGLHTAFKFNGSAKKLKEYKYLPIGTFEVEDFYAKLQSYNHTLHDFDIKLKITEENIEVEKFYGEIDRSDFKIALNVFNYPKWFQEKVNGNSYLLFDIYSNHIYPSDLLTYKGVNYLPEDYKNEDIKKLKLKGKLDLNYENDSMKSFDVFIEEAKALLTLHPLKLEKISGSIHGEKGILSANNLFVKMGNSDAKITMRYHYLKENKHLKNTFKLYSEQLDFDQLMNYEKKLAQTEGKVAARKDSFNIFQLPFSNSTVDLNIKHLKYHKLYLDNFKGRLRLQQNHYLYIDTLSMDIAKGHIDLKGYLNGSNPSEIYFSPNFYISNLDLNKVMIKADNFGQEYVVNDNIKGNLSGTIKGKIKLYPDLFPVLDKSDLEMNLMIKNGVIANFAPLRSLSDFFRDKNLNYIRFDTLQNNFILKNNELSFPAMTINTSLGFIEITGKQSMNEAMNMNYLVRVPWTLVTNAAVNKLFGGRNKNDISEDQIDDIIKRDETRKIRFINVNVTGTAENYKVSLGKK